MTPIEFTESNIVFSFDATKWSFLMQYDDQTDYKKITIPKTKAVDFIGIVDRRILSFIEIKNLKGHRIENKHRTERNTDPIDIEMAEKVRDTLAGIVGAARHSTHLKDTFLQYQSFLSNIKKDIHVVLWLEQDPIPLPNAIQNKRMQASGGNLTIRLRQKLAWLTPYVSVVNSENYDYKDSLSVKFLPVK